MQRWGLRTIYNSVKLHMQLLMMLLKQGYEELMGTKIDSTALLFIKVVSYCN